MTKRLLTDSVAGAAGSVKERHPGGAAPDPVRSSGADGSLFADVEGLSDTARRLLASGIAAFADQGYHGTTTRDIATRAGLSPAGLYVHYPSKAALLEHLTTLGHDAAGELIERTLGGDGTDGPPARLHRTVEAFVVWHAEHHLVARVVQYELRSLEGQVRERIALVRDQMESRVEHVVRLGVADGSLDVAHPRQATRAVLSLAVDVARWFDPAGRESARDVGRIYADLALRMLGAPPPPSERA